MTSTIGMLLFITSMAVPHAELHEQRLSGEEAFAHLRKLQSAEKNSFRKAAERLRAKGYTPTETVDVLQTGTPPSKRIRPVQETFVDEGGEVVYWTWSDGIDGTWEGVIYVEDYTTGATATWSTQIDVTTAQFYPLWAEQTSGGTSYRDGERMTALPRPANVPQVASLQLAVAPGDPIPEYLLVQSAADRMIAFLWCMVDSGCTPGCVMSGPVCATWRCPRAAIQCARRTLLH